MSYILDALRKAEEERSLGQVPQAKTVYGTLPARQQRSWAKMLLGLMLLLNGAALTAFFVLTVDGNTLLFSKPGVSKASQAVLKEPDNPPVSPEQREFHDHVAVTAKQPLAPKAKQQSTLSAPASALMPTTNTRQAIQVNGEAAELTPSSWQKPQDSIPHLNLDIHVYDETQQKSFVMINATRYREGEQLKEGPRLESITKDGAVLTYAGQRFRLLVGE
jgi:general secretion pathway protein B